MRCRHLAGVIVLVLNGIPQILLAQSLPVTVSGRVSGWGELYSRNGPGNASRPAQTARVTANLNLDFGGVLSVPLSALISTDQVSFRQEINQLGLNPRYRWAQVHLGYFNPRFSNYSLQDNTLRGGGVEFAPGIFRVALVTGRSRKAVQPGHGWNPATYARHATGGRIGIDAGPKGSLLLAVVHSEDDELSLSIPRDSLNLYPGRDGVVTLSGGLQLARGQLNLSGELARSNLLMAGPDPSATAEIGWAGSFQATWNQPRWSLGVSTEKLGEHFVTWGNQQLGNDQLNLTMTGRLTALDGRFNLNGMAGNRQENVSRNAVAVTNRGIYNLNLDWQATPALGFSAALTNNRNNSRAANNDTALVRNVSAQYSFTPRLVTRLGPMTSSLVTMVMTQLSDNHTGGRAFMSNSKATTLLASWSGILPSSVSLSINAARTEVLTDTLKTVVSSISPGLAFNAMQGRMQFNLQLQLSNSRTGTLPENRELGPLGELRWDMGQGQALSLRSSLRRSILGQLDGSELRISERIFHLEYARTFR